MEPKLKKVKFYEKKFCECGCGTEIHKFGSNGSILRFVKGHQPHAKKSEETKRKISLTKRNSSKTPTGDKNREWKGDEVGYLALHSWVTRWKGKPVFCEFCGCSKPRRYHWANIDHQYRRILEDYISMCPSCHRKYDNKFNRGKRMKK